MARLVALDLPAGPAFVAALSAVWDDGDAVFVVDQRLPPAAQRDLLARVGPHQVVDPSGRRQWNDPVAKLVPGDGLVVATSGSSGSPKLVVHTMAGIGSHATAVHSRLEVDPTTDRWLACLPLAHLGGLGVVLRSLLTGTALDVVEGFDAATVESAPDRLGTTLVSLVPTALDRVDTSRFRRVVLGGAADPKDRADNVTHTYGMTETGGGVIYDGIPIGDTEVAVSGEGAISLRGSTLARGLIGPTGEVEALMDEGGWLTTGDRGQIVEGRLTVFGRTDDLIITGGENVWPAPVEAILVDHPAVAEVAVIGRTDPRWGQRVVAVVVPRNADAPPTLDALRAHARDHLPVWAAPREVQIVDALPRTPLGKVRRGDL